MNIAVTANSNSENALLDTRFGRAAWIILYDTLTGKFASLPNEQNLNLPQGAGIQTASLVVNSGAKVLITSHVGPKAFAMLIKGGVQIFLAADGSVADCIERYNKGLLRETKNADVEGHW